MLGWNRYKKHNGWNLYKAVSKDPGVDRYAVGKDFILVLFKEGDIVYVYNYQVTGRREVEEMKQRAVNGVGLSGFISTHVHDKYADKIPLAFFF